ncbi:MAG: 3-succinoylsemialdehyde-pyridine dehydrogenase [Acidimicrobiales bacterium]|nr:3-succinoylsemialdehyde-pyridine dehydrogenase [Acidimicrobiales bacterium]
MLREDRLLIDGELAAASGGTFDNVNPATEETIGVAGCGTAADLDRAITAARRAFDDTDWSRDQELRADCVRQLQRALLDHLEEFRAMTVAEVGCPVMLTHMAQLDSPVAALAWVADLAEKYEYREDLGEAEPFGIPTHRWVEREPVGVVGAITPWNFPTQINLAKVAPALAAGNTVVLKPAPDTPWSASVLGRLVAEQTDFPPGVINIVTSSDHGIGALLSSDPRVDMVSFTGSTATGRKVMAAGAATVKRVFLELGGKSAYIVLDDADFDSSVGMCAFQVTTHAGQGCAITSRLLLPRSRYEEGIEVIAAGLESVPYGDPTDAGNLMGPLISAKQRERVEGYIARGLEQGARLVMGGERPPQHPRGYYLEPTLLADVDPDHTVAQEEIFGPVLVAIPYEDDDDAVAIANNSVYGLSGHVVSADRERAIEVARRVRTGTIGINGGVFYGPDVPFGGYKQSGLGREMGVAGFEEHLEIKAFAEGI